jgi:hypothetical protein
VKGLFVALAGPFSRFRFHEKEDEIMTRSLFRIVWTLLVLCLPVVMQGAPATFVSSGDQAYVEAKLDRGVRKLYTESRGDFRALLVLGEANNPELLKLSFVDASKRIVTMVLEFRTEKGTTSPGLEVDNEFIKSLSSDAKGFTDWQGRFASFPEKPTVSHVLTAGAFADPVATELVDAGGGFVFRSMRDWFCMCRTEIWPISGEVCVNAYYRCLLNTLCDAWDCLAVGGVNCGLVLEGAALCSPDMVEE